MNNHKFCTIAWLLIGVTRNVPGFLQLNNKRLAFISDQQEHCFDASLHEISIVNFPWYYFGGGLKLQIGIIEYRFSFIEPNDSLGFHSHPTNKHVSDLTGRSAGKAWKYILSDVRRYF